MLTEVFGMNIVHVNTFGENHERNKSASFGHRYQRKVFLKKKRDNVCASCNYAYV